MNLKYDLTGASFGRLTVIGRDKQRNRWTCRCACGATVLACVTPLRSGRQKSCGCLRRNIPVRENVLSNAIPVPFSGCWLWEGPLNKTGYGLFYAKTSPTKSRLAHRVSYAEFIGPIADQLNVLHRCDVRCCVNPDHLFLGTQAENMADCAIKGRHSYGISKNKGLYRTNCTLNPEQILEIRRSDLSHRELSERFGVDRSQISRIRSGKRWRDVSRLEQC